MRIDILSIFPRSFESYLQTSILHRAQEGGKVEIHVHDLRSFTTDKHKTTDDTPYGGGAGMVMKVEPFDRALTALGIVRGTPGVNILLLSAKGQFFTQPVAQTYAQCERLVLLAGRYEGVDERVFTHLVDGEISLGPYILTGGELGALVIIDAVVRLLPGVLGNRESITRESFTDGMMFEYPQYTKPEVYRGWKVPEVLLSGDHAAVEAWRSQESKWIIQNYHYDQSSPNLFPTERTHE